MTTFHQPPTRPTACTTLRYEHDACGVAHGRAARQPGRRTRSSTRRSRRWTTSSTAAPRAPTSSTGDGAGILTQMPDAFLRAAVDFELPARRQLRRRRVLPAARTRRCARKIEALLELNVRVEGQHVLGWRDVPIDEEHVGDDGQPRRARTSASSSSAPGPGFDDDQDAFERKLYVIRRIVELAAGPDFYVAVVLLAHDRLQGDADPPTRSRGFFPDLQDERFASAMALVHSRFSTNTFPSWELAHPFRVIAHNGEINTLMGNVNWMRARESRARVRAVRPRPRRRSCRSCAPAARTRRRSTTSSSCSCSPAARCRTR